MEKFILMGCLRCDAKVLDEYCEAFGVELTESDVTQALADCCGEYKDFGRDILYQMWLKVIEEFHGVLDADKFDYDFSSPSYPDFYYDGERVYSRDDLEEIAEQKA